MNRNKPYSQKDLSQAKQSTFLLYFLILLNFISIKVKSQISHPLIYNSDSMIKSGELFMEQGKYLEAINEFDQLFEIDPQKSNANQKKFLSLAYLEKIDSLYVVMNDMYNKKKMEKNAELYILYSGVLRVKENYEEAIAVLQKAEALVPNSSILHYNYALVYISLEESQKALNHLKKAILFNPNHLEAHYLLGVLCLDEGKIVEGSLALLGYLVNDPNGSHAQDIILKLNAKMSQNYTKESDLTFSELGDNFSELETILRNQLPLHPKYQLKSAIDEIFLRNFQATVEYAMTHEVKDGFFEKTYIPWLAQLGKRGWLEHASYYLINSYKDALGKKLSSKENMVKEFNNEYILKDFWSYFGKRKLPFLSDNKEYTVFIDGNGWPNEIGNTTNGITEGNYYVTNKHNLITARLFFKNNLLHGMQQYFYPSGQLSQESNYLNGKMEGLSTIYYENGAIKEEVFYKEDALDGVYKNYHPNGQLTCTGKFKNGVENGQIFCFHADGTKQVEGNVVNGELEGPYYKFNEVGDTIEKSSYKSGKLNGEYLTSFGNKLVSYSGLYENGLPLGTHSSYFPDGSISYTSKYLNGKILESNNFSRGGILQERQVFSKAELLDSTFSYDIDGNLYFVDVYNNGKLEKGYQYVLNQAKPNLVFNKSEKYISKSLDGITLNEGTVMKGFLTGNWKSFYPSGTLSIEQSYKEGRLNGTRKDYNISGQMNMKSHYIDGKMNGLWQQFKADILTQIGYHSENNRSGPFETYELNGQKTLEGYMIDNANQYAQKTYSLSGQLLTETIFDAGKEVKHIGYQPETGKIAYSIDLKNLNGVQTTLKNNGLEILTTTYKNGVKHGLETLKDSLHNTIFEMEYINGVLHGPAYINNYAGNKAFEFHYYCGSLNGLVKQFDLKGNLKAEYNLLFGETHGKSVRYYPSGQAMVTSQNWKDKKTGISNYYNQSGKLIAAIEYLSDFIINYQILDEKGELGDPVKLAWGSKMTIHSKYKNGKPAFIYDTDKNNLEGRFEIYNEDGNLCYKSFIKNGLLQGERLEYYPDGMLYKKENFENEDYQGIQEYFDENGKILISANYLYDYLHGELKLYKNGNLEKTKIFDTDNYVQLK